MGTTFLLTVVAWVFFRAESIPLALRFLKGIISQGLLQIPSFNGGTPAVVIVLFVFGLLTVEWMNRGKAHSFNRLPKNRSMRYSIYYILVVTIILNSGSEQEFIYFQF